MLNDLSLAVKVSFFSRPLRLRVDAWIQRLFEYFAVCVLWDVVDSPGTEENFGAGGEGPSAEL